MANKPTCENCLTEIEEGQIAFHEVRRFGFMVFRCLKCTLGYIQEYLESRAGPMPQ